MEIGNDGNTQMYFTADNQNALEMLQRDARGLERALQDSGIKADAGSMQFNLRQQQQPGSEQNGQNNSNGTGHNLPLQESHVDATDALNTTLATIEQYNHAVSYGLDVRI
jgi:flagellar hook-length control protein FliK